MKRFVLIAILMLMVAVVAQAQAPGTGITGTKHDLSATGGSTTFRSNNVNRICVFCHTPHQPDAPFFDVDPLWNHTLSTVTSYGVYASATLNATPTDLGGGTAVSNLCLSCHDGTVGLGSQYNPPNEVAGGPSNAATLLTGNALLGTDLSNDHPVNFTYDSNLASADGELVDPPPAARLFAGTVQCASCHEPHNKGLGVPFLVVDNTGSALCLGCHLK